MNEIDLRRIDLNLLVVFEVLMTERSVTRAADRLGRTQSAVSHALARLREQVGDPLLVKHAGGMRASPFAESLAEQVRPILRSIQRVLVPPQAFDPATSRRVFRVALPDLTPSLFPLLMARVRREAPGASVEWVTRTRETMLALAEGQTDVALLPSAMPLQDGLEREEVGALKWATFARRDHPAAADWGVSAWARWPHVVVSASDRMESPVTHATGGDRRRTVGARVPQFSAVAPLLAHTDLLATLPIVVMHEDIERFGLCALPAPIPVAPMPHSLVWGQRLGNDPALRWIRGHLREVFSEVLSAADRLVPRPAGRTRTARRGTKR